MILGSGIFNKLSLDDEWEEERDEEESDNEEEDDDCKEEYFIPKTSFKRLVKEIAQDFSLDFSFQKEAIDALQQVSEEYIIKLFHDANKCAEHAKRQTVALDDIRLVRSLRQNKSMNFELS